MTTTSPHETFVNQPEHWTESQAAGGPPGACSGPLAPTPGGHSPARPSASAVQVIDPDGVAARVDFNFEVRKAVMALRAWRRLSRAGKACHVADAHRDFIWHFSRVMLVAAPRTSTRRQLDRATMLQRALGRVLGEQPDTLTRFVPGTGMVGI
jgi:hypothetical protein